MRGGLPDALVQECIRPVVPISRRDVPGGDRGCRSIVAAAPQAGLPCWSLHLPKIIWRSQSGLVGRPSADRVALARAFLAKAIWDLPTTRDLIDRIDADPVLRRLCGWPRRSAIPSEATFSRAFAEFAATDLPGRMHEALVTSALETTIVGHVSRDSTAIEAREKPAPKPRKDEKPKRRRGRPRKGEEVVKEEKRLDRQLHMDLPEMLADLPKQCDRGTKRNARGHTVSWNGYKLHIDAARRRHPARMSFDLGVDARQPGVDPDGGTDRTTGDISLRVDGLRLRCEADPRVQ